MSGNRRIYAFLSYFKRPIEHSFRFDSLKYFIMNNRNGICHGSWGNDHAGNHFIPYFVDGRAGNNLEVPVDYYKLDNGLKVVLSPDKTAPIIAVGVYYNIGFRIEPRDRTGFAHLFEHMMFQGSQNLGKMEFIQLVQKNGGILNGSPVLILPIILK